MANASETTGAWDTVTVFPSSRYSRLARRLLSFDRERSEARSDSSRDRVTSPTSRGSRTLPARPVAIRRSRPVTPRAIPTRAVAVRRRRLISPRHRALDCLTASGKRSESRIAETGHGSCPTESGLHDPSLFPNPQIGKHERIANRSGQRKTLPTHHVAERAVMSGERPPRKQREQGASAANEQLPRSPPPEGAEETGARSRAPDERPETLPPLSLDLGRAGGEEAPRDAAPGASRDPPFLACPPEGREEEEASGCKTSEEVPARGEVFIAGGREPEGRACFLSL